LFEKENGKKSDIVIPIEKNEETQLSTVANENSSTPVGTSSSLQHDEDKESKCGNLSRKLSKLSTQE
jgi:hypothetical protein